MSCSICTSATTQRCADCKLRLCADKACIHGWIHFSICGKNEKSKENSKFIEESGLQQAVVEVGDGLEFPLSQMEKTMFDAFQVLVSLALFDLSVVNQLCSTSKLYRQLCSDMRITAFYPDPVGGKGQPIRLAGPEELAEYVRTYREYQHTLTNLWFHLVPQLLASRAYRLYERFRNTESVLPKDMLYALLRNGTLHAWNTYGGEALYEGLMRKTKAMSAVGRNNHVSGVMENMVSSSTLELFLAKRELWENLVNLGQAFLFILKYQRRANWFDWLAMETEQHSLVEYRNPATVYDYAQLKYSVGKLPAEQAKIARRLLKQLLTPEQYVTYKATAGVKPYELIEPEQHKLSK